MKRATTWRGKTTDELEMDLKSLKKKLFEIRAKKPVESLANPSELKEMKRNIARILTILNEKGKEKDGKEKESKAKEEVKQEQEKQESPKVQEKHDEQEKQESPKTQEEQGEQEKQENSETQEKQGE